MTKSSIGNNNQDIDFLQWALPKMDYRWDGFRKPRGQVLKRIRERMAELELSGGFGEYRQYLEEHPEEWEKLDALCDVTISKFFRDRKLWDFMRDIVLREHLCIASAGSDDTSEAYFIWSAGCCNGEEAYSLAIIYEQLKEKEEGCSLLPVRIIATDRNEEVLQRAADGRYPSGALKELKPEEIETYLHEQEQDSENDGSNQSRYYKIRKQLQKNITFEKRDIRESIPDYTFDMVLCRNLVFTYFSAERQKRFLKRLKPHLKQGSYLVIGSNEEIPETEWLEPVSDTHPVYKSVVS